MLPLIFIGGLFGVGWAFLALEGWYLFGMFADLAFAASLLVGLLVYGLWRACGGKDEADVIIERSRARMAEQFRTKPYVAADGRIWAPDTVPRDEHGVPLLI